MRSLSILPLLFILVLGQVNGQLVVPKEPDPRPVPALDAKAPAVGEKSVLLAAVASLVLPGLGELYAGDFSSGKYQMAADGALWITYAAFRSHANWLQADAKTFAAENAGADFTGKDDNYMVNVGSYMSMTAYNEVQLRDRAFDLVYNDPSYAWSWNSSAARATFRDMRVRKDEALVNSKFVVAALVVNRIISAFSAGRSAARSNARAAESSSLSLSVSPAGPLNQADGLIVNLSTSF